MAPKNNKEVHGFPAWLQLVRAYNYMEARISADLRRADLTLARFHVLVALAKHGPMSQQTLADHLLVTKGNVVGLIDKLSARGLSGCIKLAINSICRGRVRSTMRRPAGVTRSTFTLRSDAED